jgi:octaprenyl-diphosphate synthase
MKAIHKQQDFNQKNTAFDYLSALLADDLREVNKLILKRLQSPVHLIPKLAEYLVSSGGKRLRPLLVLVSAKLCKYEGRRHINLSACIEFIHTATLLHDDVVDESHLRRGQQSAHMIWGNPATVLVGDFLFSKSFQLMVEDGCPNILNILSTTSRTIIEGEVLQLISTNNIMKSKEHYFKVARDKTAHLFETACRIGAIIASRPKEEESALASFGDNLGMAFQLTDDVLDYSAEQAKLGKAIGDDFKEGKVTYPIILAYLRGPKSEKEFWHRTIEKLEQNENDFEYALKLLEKHQALRDTLQEARVFGDKARQALDGFTKNELTNMLCEFVDFCIDRAY